MILPRQADTNVFFCGMKCVVFQAMNGPRQGSLNAKLVRVLLWCFVLILDISILVTFITRKG